MFHLRLRLFVSSEKRYARRGVPLKSGEVGDGDGISCLLKSNYLSPPEKFFEGFRELFPKSSLNYSKVYLRRKVIKKLLHFIK